MGDVCCSPFNKHTEEDQLADDMQEDERERLTMMNRRTTGKYYFLLLLELTPTDVRYPCYTRRNIEFF